MVITLAAHAHLGTAGCASLVMAGPAQAIRAMSDAKARASGKSTFYSARPHYPSSFQVHRRPVARRQPDDHVAVAFAVAAQSAQPLDDEGSSQISRWPFSSTAGSTATLPSGSVASIASDPDRDADHRRLPLNGTAVSGSAVAYARSIPQLGDDMRTIRPTVLVAVPRIYERAYTAIRSELTKKGPLARGLFDFTERLGWRRFLASQGAAPPPSPFLSALMPILDRLVAAKVRAEFGGRLRQAIAGGAPMPSAVSRLFLAMEIDVLQGYGMTETSPIVSVNSPTRNDPAAVGEPIESVEVRIGADDELMVRGPNVMMGYWRREAETARVLEPDGWLHTGDKASLKDGLITIRGRIKDIIVTSTGEKISPADLEQAIIADPFFDQVMVIGEQRPFIAALAVLNRSAVEQAAKDLGIAGELDEALQSEQFRALALAKIGRAVAQFPKYATPRKVWLTVEPWTIGAALITPTLKPKRLAIERAFAAEIERLYAK